ncbi:hypothetical protein [Dysgonomonas termitidis]|uniref:Uncharacterized protein n=1 Tax=Dysgonomonas termitidis TaxID=1516126 RepID=A0ABV9KUN5_9BACT
MDTAELKKTADSVFKRYPKVDKVYITTDGQPFFDEVHAKNHAAKKELDVETFRRKEAGAADIGNMDRAGLEGYIRDNKLDIAFYAETPDEDLRTMIANATGKKPAPAKAKTTTSKKTAK